jgi:peptidase C25-like protein
VKFINDGVFCINYLGHGGGYTWDNNVLPYGSFDVFVYGKPFIVNSLTCFTNTFSNSNALGEMFIRHPRGGVSVLSSTGYGWINSNYYIYEKLMQHMFEDKMSHGQATQVALADYFFSTFGRNANFIDQIDGRIIYKYFRKSLFYQMCILGDPSATFPHNENITTDVSPHSVAEGDDLNFQVDRSGITNGYLDIVGSRGNERKFPIKQKIDLNFSQGTAQYTMPPLLDNIYDGLLQLTYWDNENNIFTSSASIAFNSPFVENVKFSPDQPNVMDSAVTIEVNVEASITIDSLQLLVYSNRSLNTVSKKLSMIRISNGKYQSEKKIIYTSKTAFYTTENDTSNPSSYYSGNYFVPVMYANGEVITGDYYFLAPTAELEQDISILDYSVENGKSKLILYNQADTSVYVKVDLSINESGFTYSFSDTVLTNFDVNGQYEEGHEKINTYYFDFLPLYGSSTLNIVIDPIAIDDSDTSNNHLEINIENKWLKCLNDHFVNFNSDTVNLSGTTINSISPAVNSSFDASIYLNDYDRNYNLSEFGATQAALNVLYVNSTDNEIGLLGSIENELLVNKIICYLNTDLDMFYVLPISPEDSLSYFPITKPGYYLLAQADETIAPSIELNINAREILVGGYVSERSDFSVILKDDHGVNPLPYFWDILLDGEELSEDNLSLLESDDIRELGINFKLDMEVGEHTLQVIAHDLVGNRTETEIYDIVYTGESQLIDYGTFPNPFTNKTTFIYELTEQFDDVTIKIFTLSGQKIFTMSVSENAVTDLPLYSIGYHEIPWYGKDEFGNTVANGVYFYIIEGIVDDKSVKSTGKIAKLR